MHDGRDDGGLKDGLTGFYILRGGKKKADLAVRTRPGRDQELL